MPLLFTWGHLPPSTPWTSERPKGTQELWRKEEWWARVYPVLHVSSSVPFLHFESGRREVTETQLESRMNILELENTDKLVQPKLCFLEVSPKGKNGNSDLEHLAFHLRVCSMSYSSMAYTTFSHSWQWRLPVWTIQSSWWRCNHMFPLLTFLSQEVPWNKPRWVSASHF